MERQNTAGISDDKSLSDSFSDAGSKHNGYRSGDEQHSSGPRKNLLWDEIDKQRLRLPPGIQGRGREVNLQEGPREK